MNQNTELNSKIIDKVKKLISLSESPNEAEAASALSKAKILLAKYGLEMSDCHKNNIDIGEKVLLKGKRIRSWKTQLIACVLSSTFTQALHITNGAEGKIVLIGREENITAAYNLFDYLVNAISATSNNYKGVVRHLDSFRTGMVTAIQKRLEEQNNTQNTMSKEKALVISMKTTADRENKEYLNENYGKTKSKKVNRNVDSNSFGLGQAVGGEISLHDQIKKK